MSRREDDFLKKYCMYRRDVGVIHDGIGSPVPYVLVANATRVDLPLRQGVRSAGFVDLEMVDVHTILALSGRDNLPGHGYVAERILRPNSPPGCIQVCRQHRGRIRFTETHRVIELFRPVNSSTPEDTPPRKIKIPLFEPDFGWFSDGDPFTAYEVYLVSGMYKFPVELGRKLLFELAYLMSSDGLTARPASA